MSKLTPHDMDKLLDERSSVQEYSTIEVNNKTKNRVPKCCNKWMCCYITSSIIVVFIILMVVGSPVVPGWLGGLIVVILFFAAVTCLRLLTDRFDDVDLITFYWVCATILTMVWEICYICSHQRSVDLAKELKETNKSSWTELWPISIVLPSKTSEIFYADYGAWADREYMTDREGWSRLIEGTHAIFCGGFGLIALIIAAIGGKDRKYRLKYRLKYIVAISVSMGAQLMNSILYIGGYAVQCNQPGNMNYPTDEFPLGPFCIKRLFFYCNAFWTIMPSYAIIMLFHKHTLH